MHLLTRTSYIHTYMTYIIYIEVSTKPAAVDAEVYIASSNNGTYTVSSYRIDPFGKTNFSLGVTQETEKPVRV